ncbi:MAG: alpha/beta hydrolase [Pseudomonadota bacterium]
MQIDNQIRLSSGYQLGYARYGRDNGIPVFYFHGLPGSRRECGLLHQACLDLNVQLIAPDRPGYGLSEMVAGSRLRQWPQTVVELADQLGLTRFYLFAVSGGAPYALACASLLRERVMGTGICCGLAEVANAELRTNMPVYARLGFRLAQWNPAWLKICYGLPVEAAARFMPGSAIDILAWIQGEPDCSVLRQPEIKRFFAENLREAFRQGSSGSVADMRAASEPWPFEPSPIKSLKLWHGRQDRLVPATHSEWLAGIVPSTRLETVEGEGHFSLPVHYATRMVEALVQNR